MNVCLCHLGTCFGVGLPCCGLKLNYSVKLAVLKTKTLHIFYSDFV